MIRWSVTATTRPSELGTTNSWLRRIASRGDLAAGVVACATGLYLSFRFASEAGPLWRDEVSTVNLASQSRFVDMFRLLSVDSMPLFYPAVLRLWLGFGWTDQDSALRFFGFLVAMATVAAVWLAARSVGAGVPLFTLVVFGLHGVVLQTLGSLKPYGVGTILLFVAFAGIWRVAVTGALSTIVWASAGAILAVNTVYQNLPLIGVLCAAAAAARVLARDWRAIARLSIVAICAALAVVPYMRVLAESQDWHAGTGGSNTIGEFLSRFALIVSDWSRPLLVIWAIALVAVTAGSIWLLRAKIGDRILVAHAGFAAVAVPASLVGFFKIWSMATTTPARTLEPWHVASVIGVMAFCLDLLFLRAPVLRVIRGVLAISAAVVLLPIASNWVAVRQTNIDLLATHIRTGGLAGDLVVLNPWFLGITFNRYYGDGPAPWITVPPIEDIRVHRYDLVKRRMENVDTMAPVYSAVAKSLKSGHRVWLVGGALFLPPDQTPDVLPPAPLPTTGWSHAPYYRAWSAGLGRFLQTHAEHVTVVRVPAGQPVWQLEGTRLMVADGWRQP